MFYPKNMSGNLQGWEYLPASAGTYKAGQMLNVSGEKLAAIGSASTETPGYLCMADITVTAGETIPVTRVRKDQIYVTVLSAQASSAVMGSLLEVSAGGLAVDATAAGSFEVVYIGGTAAGSEVHGRFK